MEIIKDIAYSNFWKVTTIILLLVMGCSCGTRKVEKSVIKDYLTTEQATTEKKDIVLNKETTTIINDETNEIEVTPIDTSKVLIINGKTYKNAKVKILNRKIKTDISAKESLTDKSKLTNNVKTKNVKSNIVKKTEKQSFSFWWLLIPIAVYLIWKYKYKLIGL